MHTSIFTYTYIQFVFYLHIFYFKQSYSYNSNSLGIWRTGISTVGPVAVIIRCDCAHGLDSWTLKIGGSWWTDTNTAGIAWLSLIVWCAPQSRPAKNVHNATIHFFIMKCAARRRTLPMLPRQQRQVCPAPPHQQRQAVTFPPRQPPQCRQ